MPSFQQLLEQTMPFFAARAHGVEPVRMTTDFAVTEPSPDDPFNPEKRLPGDKRSPADVIMDNMIWQFEQKQESPALFENLRVWSRGMGMNYTHPVPVLPRLEWGDLTITHAAEPEDANGVKPPPIKRALALSPEFVVGAWYVPPAHIPENDRGLWQLPANTDTSFVVAFAFEETYEGRIVPLDMPAIDDLGEKFMPEVGGVTACLDLTMVQDTTVRVCIEKSRWVAFVALTTCRERPDFAPGKLVGFARFFPHLQVMSNTDMDAVEASLLMERPAAAMTHGDAQMGTEIKPILVTDSNKKRSFTRHVPGFDEMPVPVTSNIYDYYEVEPATRFSTRKPRRLSVFERALLSADELRKLDESAVEDHPEQRVGEVTLADARRTVERELPDCVRRDGGDLESITKMPRQGQFDNLHLAPRMRVEFVDRTRDPAPNIVLDDIAMVFVCLHDCVHMHVRWAGWATDKIVAGFDGNTPYAKPGAPAVPSNQTVFLSFPTPHSVVYLAFATTCAGGGWTVFCHHGAGYAIDAWPAALSKLFTNALRRSIEETTHEPAPAHPDLPNPSWPGFYWRCRWASTQEGADVIAERLSTPDIEWCLR
jgi:hypothetical protein